MSDRLTSRNRSGHVLILSGKVSWLCALAIVLSILAMPAQAQNPPGNTVFDLVPVGSTGPVTSLFGNSIEIPAGADDGSIVVELELRVSGWATTGDGLIQSVQAIIDGTGYCSGGGDPLNPLGYPGAPLLSCPQGNGCPADGNTCKQGAFVAINVCVGTSTPCPNGVSDCPAGDTCEPNTNYLFSGFDPLGAVSYPGLNYEFFGVSQLGGKPDTGNIEMFGTLLVEIPAGAAGRYNINFSLDTERTFNADGQGDSYAVSNLNGATITITTGQCCFDIFQFPPQCMNEITESMCASLPQPSNFRAGALCPPLGPDCHFCIVDSECDDSNACTDDNCNQASGVCSNIQNYNNNTDCCDPAGGSLTSIDDFDECTNDNCNPGTGQVSHNPIVGCVPNTIFDLVPIGSTGPVTSLSGNSIEIPGGADDGSVVVELELRASSWATTGDGLMGALQATIDGTGYCSGVGDALNPLGYPGVPLLACPQGNGCPVDGSTCDQGGFIATDVCVGTSTPCPNGVSDCPVGGVCGINTNYIYFGFDYISGVDYTGLNYGYWGISQVGRQDIGTTEMFGTLLVEIPAGAAGTYNINFSPDSGETFNIDGLGDIYPVMNFNRATITVTSGACCYDIGPGTTKCVHNVSESTCNTLVQPANFRAGVQCPPSGPGNNGPDSGNGPLCDFCDNDIDCNDNNACTDDNCDLISRVCSNPLIYDYATQCCDVTTGAIVTFSDGDLCTFDFCDRQTLEVTNTPIAGCKIISNRYATFFPNRGNQVVNYRVTESVSGRWKWILPPSSAEEITHSIARLTDTMPAPRVWNSAALHIGDCIIAPGHLYRIESTTDGISFSSAGFAVTANVPSDGRHWADIVSSYDINFGQWRAPDGLVTASDILAIVQAFRLVPTSIPVTWADLTPERPNGIVSSSDILAVVLAFQFEPYPYADPLNCP